MNIEHLLAEIEGLSPQQLQQVKEGIAHREEALGVLDHPRTIEEWVEVLDQVVDELWADTSEDEQKAMLAAIRLAALNYRDESA